MPPRQLTPQETVDLANVALRLAHDPQTRPYFAKLMRARFPERAGSFKDVEIDEKLNSFRRELEQKDLVAQGKELQRKMDASRADLISSGRYNDKQADEIKALMDKHFLTDYKLGAVLYAHENPPTDMMLEPPGQRPSATWEFSTVNGRDGKAMTFADFVRSPTAAASDAAYQVIDEFMRGRSRAHRLQ